MSIICIFVLLWIENICSWTRSCCVPLLRILDSQRTWWPSVAVRSGPSWTEVCSSLRLPTLRLAMIWDRRYCIGPSIYLTRPPFMQTLHLQIIILIHTKFSGTGQPNSESQYSVPTAPICWIPGLDFRNVVFLHRAATVTTWRPRFENWNPHQAIKT